MIAPNELIGGRPELEGAYECRARNQDGTLCGEPAFYVDEILGAVVCEKHRRRHLPWQKPAAPATDSGGTPAEGETQ